MKVKTTELLDGETVESWEDRGPTRAVVYDDLAGIAAQGYITAERVA